MNAEIIVAVITGILAMVISLAFLVLFGFASYEHFFSAKKQKALARLLNAIAEQVEASNSPPSGEDK